MALAPMVITQKQYSMSVQRFLRVVDADDNTLCGEYPEINDRDITDTNVTVLNGDPFSGFTPSGGFLQGEDC